MKAKSIGILSSIAVAVIAATAVLGGLASLSSAASGGPTVVLSSTTGSSTNAATIPVTATFSESVNGLTSANVTATNATVGVVSGSGALYTFNLTPTATGTVTVMIAADVSSSTASSTGNQLSNTLTFTYDTTAPVLVEVTGVASTTASSSPSYVFSSSEAGTMNVSGTNCTLASTSTVAVSGNNTLQFATLADGSYSCSLSVADAAGNTSNTLAINFTVDAVPAPVAPIISNVHVESSGTTSAQITWTTDLTSTSQVFYGTSASYGSQTLLDANATTTHSVSLSGLSEATLYHFKVESTNAGGTTASADVVFTTASTASSTPLMVSGTDNVQTNATADGTFEHGWQWILHLVVPSVESNFAMKFGNFFNTANASTTFAAANNIRIWSPQSSNASTTASAMTATGNGYSNNMMLSGDTSLTTPGRQIDVYIQAAVPSGTPTGNYSTTFGALSTTTPF